MKHIAKGQPLKAFADSVSKLNPANWEDLHEKAPYVIGQSKECIAINEQNLLSGYTEMPLSLKEDMHIDHFFKRALFPSKIFDWDNFVVDDHNANYGADYKDRHTQDAKDYQYIINPVTEHPEDMMTYDYPDFKIVPNNHIDEADKYRVRFTVDRFNLNHASLTRKRFDIYKVIESVISQLSDQEIKVAVEEQGQPTFVDWAICHLRMNLM